VNSTADVMVDALHNGFQFLEFLRKFQIEAKVLVEDLSKYRKLDGRMMDATFPSHSLRLIEEKEIRPTGREKLAKSLSADGGPSSLRDDPESRFDNFGLRMGEYYDYTEMTSFMQRIQNAMPTRAQMRTIGWTVEGRPIQGIQFGSPADTRRPVAWIDAGIHAREWTAIHAALYFIYYVISI
jgi:hypothetical protein